MHQEINRLQTFSEWPSDAQVSPQRIAKAGFFATKQGLEVECFACHAKISEWNYGDQVMTRHIALNRDCPFVLNPSTSGNVPITSSRVPSTSINMYRSSETRLASFENWPAADIVTPDSLVQAGFYYLKEGDNTQCAFCKGVVRAWEVGDDPDTEHQRHFPNCPFVMAVINPRLQARRGSNDRNNPENNQIVKDSFPNINVVGTEQNLGELGVQAHRGPKKSNFATVEARLRSYVGWSSDLIQTPEVLAEAGFYYEGMGDQVRCFHCDGGLRTWDPHDDPWTEHARWFPNCSFVKLVKGQDFVTACTIGQTTDSSVRPSAQRIQTTRIRREVTEREIQSYLTSPQALAALSIGLNVERVKRAIREKLEQTGRAYSQPDALVEAALNLQHEEEDPNSHEHYTPIDRSLRNVVCAAMEECIDRQPEQVQQPEPAQQPEMDEAFEVSPTTAPDGTPQLHYQLVKTVSLEEENRILKEARLCKICMDSEVGIVFLPCGHLATCVNCAPNLEDCPVCRSTIKATVRTFFS
ncbi:death-associated inhibitor of apoptosis 2 [Diabrotica virgifera virgifera]|uniref:Death-associated inhibitor of apoptosis 2 n=1 Tax=Diabrotica virgifera virgifera TaxID=50390 RepID=A0A6P7FTB2_DIAVI|nr:death-associated inhibitor of apoptosis 2 [Diabrotica virgifera virgifera]